MKRKILFLFATLIATIAVAGNSSEDYLRAFTSRSLRAEKMDELKAMSDGEHYTMLSSDGKKIILYNFKTGAEEKTLLDVENTKGVKIKKITGYEFDSTENRILVSTELNYIYRRSFNTSYYLYNVSRNELEPLSEKENTQQMAHFSPNGRLVAFASGNNLYIKKLMYGTEIQITKDGQLNEIINGTPDWVYEEEFGLTCCFIWSKDSKLLAWTRFDEKEVKEFAFDKYDYPYDNSYKYKYPKAGETNSSVSVHVYDVENRTTKQMDCGEGNDIYFPIMKWTNDPNVFALVRMNRNQTELDLLSVNARSGVATALVREKENEYIDYENYNCLTFMDDNSFVALSERDGWKHIYMYNQNGMMLKQLTKGNWEVTDLYRYDIKTGECWFQATKEKSTERHIYKLDKKGKITCLDNKPGTHSAVVTPHYLIDDFSDAETPDIFTLYDSKGKKIRTIMDNSALKETIASYQLPKKEFFTLKTAEGIELNAWIVKPKEMKPGKKYPLVMVQYSGPGSQEVKNKYTMDWEMYLAMEGYVVACVDPRGTGARGRQFRNESYKQLGIIETHDQIEAAKVLGQMEFVDAKRICIWGWSYGGFMALNCMINGGGSIFKAGIAIAPVTDWRLYDSTYTERFMQTPQSNDRGYEKSEIISKAGQLKGKLLLCHGTADDNVHIQHSMLFVENMIKAGVDFEMQVYPNKNHSILGNETRLHLYRRFNKFIKDNL
ncbi:MAG: DPP IV N-terminal domain-containing protein [Paludibacteraceae bacterium]|nr:DPP IV N-terminal domain-containing protein [Paludibacteraceae bacterium]